MAKEQFTFPDIFSASTAVHKVIIDLEHQGYADNREVVGKPDKSGIEVLSHSISNDKGSVVMTINCDMGNDPAQLTFDYGTSKDAVKFQKMAQSAAKENWGELVKEIQI